MGMPITVEIVDDVIDEPIFQAVYDYFARVDERFSTYKASSEISRINAGLPQSKWSAQMKRVLALCEQTKRQTNGFFDIKRGGQIDPSGLVKGWAIRGAARILKHRGCKNYYIDAGSDIQVSGQSGDHSPWRVGIKNPFNESEIVKVLQISSQGVATSGNYIRGAHIYNPLGALDPKVASLTIIGRDVYQADRFATAAFAMGEAAGVNFIENFPGLEAYLINDDKIATMTSGFGKFVAD